MSSSDITYFDYENSSLIWYVESGDFLHYGKVSRTLRLRPVLNLKTDTNVTGSGASDDHWVVQ